MPSEASVNVSQPLFSASDSSYSALGMQCLTAAMASKPLEPQAS